MDVINVTTDITTFFRGCVVITTFFFRGCVFITVTTFITTHPWKSVVISVTTDIKTIIYNDAYDFGPGSVVINEVVRCSESSSLAKMLPNAKDLIIRVYQTCKKESERG